MTRIRKEQQDHLSIVKSKNEHSGSHKRKGRFFVFPGEHGYPGRVCDNRSECTDTVCLKH